MRALVVRWFVGMITRATRIRLRDALFLTLPALAFTLYLTVGAVLDYRNLVQFDDWWSNGASVRSAFGGRARTALHLPAAMRLRARMDAAAVDPGIVRLRVDWGLWKDRFQDPLRGWDRWTDAELVSGGGIQRVEIRKRGDTSINWTTEKKSFTLETSKANLFKSHRRLAFSAKEILPQYVISEVASEFDLLIPNQEIAPVFLNGRFYGLFRVMEVIDESFLRRQGRMPGNIYRGDTAERGEYFKGLPRPLFQNPYIWDRVAENNHAAVQHLRGGHAVLIEALNGSTFEDHLGLMSRVDREEIARLVAAMLVAGDPYHMSGIHNQFWYEDPATALLHPVVWDLRLRDLDSTPHRLNLLLRGLLRDPFVVDRVLHEIHSRTINGDLLQVAQDRVSGAYERFRPYFEYEWLRHIVPDVGSPDEVLSQLRRNLEILRSWMADARIAYNAQPRPGEFILDFETRGYAGLDLTAFDITGSHVGLETLQLWADRNRNGRLDPSDAEVAVSPSRTESGGRITLLEPEGLLPGWDTGGQGIQPGRVHYRFFVTGPDSIIQRITRIRPDLRNRVTGARQTPAGWSTDERILPSSSWSPWQYPPDSFAVHRWSGRVSLDRTFRAGRGDTLVIAPGTVVELGPDVSIVSQGTVLAAGTEDEPIVFRPAVSGRPWGALALQGPTASGSRFQHVRFEFGGGAVVDRVEYSGMVSVHRAQDVVFRDVEFVRNVRSDDALRALYAHVELKRCRFLDANADGIDFDSSSGSIEDCSFEDSGNDAIDLMTSDPLIVGNRMSGSRDKGISIGERSRPLIFNNHITRSDIGIEVKDASEPVLLHNVIRENRLGLLQRVKNWRYGEGGWAKLIGTVIEANEQDIQNDPDSRLTVPAPAVTGIVGMTEDAVTTAGRARVPDWIYVRHGIRPDSADPGLVAGWTPTVRIDPVFDLDFKNDFGRSVRRWVRSGGVEDVRIQDRNLVARVYKHEGSIRRSIDWEVGTTASYWLVIEVATRDVISVDLVLGTEGGPGVSVPVEITENLSDFRFMTVPLPPGRYRFLELKVRPDREARVVDPRTGFIEAMTGRVAVHGVQVHRVRRPEAAALATGEAE